MISLPLSLLALWLATSTSPALAVTGGSFADGGNTQVSAMMMFVGNSKKVYILDKAEGNQATIQGHPAWGAVWDIDTHQVQLMNIRTNTFCASGMHLPNGSFVTFGGNGAVSPGGGMGSDVYPAPNNYSAFFDQTYQDYDGTKAIRVLNPCGDSDDFTSTKCQWFDNPAVLSMQKSRWYSAAEPLGDGTIAIIGGFTNGGYINRNYPNTDPDGPAAQNSVEFFPSNGQPAAKMQFLIQTSGLNSYAHTYLLASGKMFVQANVSTMIWDPSSSNPDAETPLPNMPNNVARVYPASGAVAMLPLTPANNYTQTIIFCGGTDMPDEAWGNYSYPAINTWDYVASADCQRITPEPADGSSPAYVKDDNMLETRTMGQFVVMPTGKLLVVNGALNGTAGYSNVTSQTVLDGNYPNPYGFSLASGPVGTPAIYDPGAPQGKRWSNTGLGTSSIPRLYHSTAILLPDASILIAGSNPNVDVNLTTVFPTTYQAEVFYPPYFSATTRPQPSGIPSTLSYGGNSFDITLPASSYSGSANDAADSAIIAVIRPGWTTHAMTMGQRFLQLNNTYTVNSDGSIVFHTSQMPPNANLFQPGPAFVYVTINGIPSNGTYVIVGNGNIGTQPTAAVSNLPSSVRLDSASGSANSATTGGGSPATSSSGTSHTAAIIGAIVGVVAVLGIIGAIIGICLARRRREAAEKQVFARSTSNNTISNPMMSMAGAQQYPNSPAMAEYPGPAYGAGVGMNNRAVRSSDSSSFLPLQDNASRISLNRSAAPSPSPYQDHYFDNDAHSGRGSGMGMSMEYDPYTRERLAPASRF